MRKQYFFLNLSKKWGVHFDNLFVVLAVVFTVKSYLMVMYRSLSAVSSAQILYF